MEITSKCQFQYYSFNGTSDITVRNLNGPKLQLGTEMTLPVLQFWA